MSPDRSPIFHYDRRSGLADENLVQTQSTEDSRERGHRQGQSVDARPLGGEHPGYEHGEAERKCGPHRLEQESGQRTVHDLAHVAVDPPPSWLRFGEKGV